MAERISALHSYESDASEGAIALGEIENLTLHQISAWHDSIEPVAKKAAQAIATDSAPAPGQVVSSANGSLLRIAPLTWWLVGGEAPTLTPAEGSILDLSHSRTHVRISGEQASVLLNRHVSLDLRPASFPVGRVAATELYFVGVTLWHSPHGYELFIPRSFALSVWEMLAETATQFDG